MAHSEPSAEDTTQQALAELRLSIDSEQGDSRANGATTNGVNGKVAAVGSPRTSGELSGHDRLAAVQRELERCRKEKDDLATQYSLLVSRLNSMRTTLGNKLKQDAEELDRREQLIQQLSMQNEDMNETVQTLQNEIITSNAEAERASKELENMRSRVYEESSQEALVRERELRDLQVELERCRMERDEWEGEALEGRVNLDEAKMALENFKRDLELESEVRERLSAELEMEREKATNLQSVLEDFQLSKDHELRQAVRDRDTQLTQVTQALAEYKHRAHTAELKLEETSATTSRTVELEREVKEKNLLIGKIRHEAVILNEHLTEALRRLRKNQSDNNVDRRLVTNVLLSFLTTPRADGKRFEMLNLLSTILSWGDVEREKAGLQRASSWTRTSNSAGPQSKGKGASELDLSDETESFSQRWVEFLLKESSTSSSADGSLAPLHSPTSSAPTPSRSNLSLPSLPGSPKSGAASPGQVQRTLRLASFSAMASSPNLSAAAAQSSPPPRDAH
ncbi:hypothetical protein M0805_008485 [Coniferiporia weirii]|nr:hypothetical protein M0805_008485 [Coniferiporia weirii]